MSGGEAARPASEGNEDDLHRCGKRPYSWLFDPHILHDDSLLEDRRDNREAEADIARLGSDSH